MFEGFKKNDVEDDINKQIDELQNIQENFYSELKSLERRDDFEIYKANLWYDEQKRKEREKIIREQEREKLIREKQKQEQKDNELLDLSDKFNNIIIKLKNFEENLNKLDNDLEKQELINDFKKEILEEFGKAFKKLNERRITNADEYSELNYKLVEHQYKYVLNFENKDELKKLGKFYPPEYAEKFEKLNAEKSKINLIYDKIDVIRQYYDRIMLPYIETNTNVESPKAK